MVDMRHTALAIVACLATACAAQTGTERAAALVDDGADAGQEAADAGPVGMLTCTDEIDPAINFVRCDKGAFSGACSILTQWPGSTCETGAAGEVSTNPDQCSVPGQTEQWNFSMTTRGGKPYAYVTHFVDGAQETDSWLPCR
jgi:hypothetical protein